MNFIKVGATIITTLGVSKVVGDIIKNNTVVTTTAQKVLVNSGSFILGAMMVDQANTYVSKTIDAIAQNVRIDVSKSDLADGPGEISEEQ